MRSYDVIVVGGGPAGSSAAWRAATLGARVLLVDKAVFPRDKPCGDGLTPRAVRSLTEIGLGESIARYARVDGLRVFGAGRKLEFPWPSSDGFPRHGFVVPRTDLDELALRHAQAAGAEVLEGAESRGPLLEEGLVRGVRLRHAGGEHECRSAVLIAADGATSRICRGAGMSRIASRPMGIAVRAQMPAARVHDGYLESYLELVEGGDLLPGYGWIFPMDGGVLNVGVGLLSTYAKWREVNTAHLMRAFLGMLPPEWRLAGIDELRASGQLKGWRLPMGFSVWPPWRPGVLAAGDAAGVVNPFNGEGISEAVESGVAAADAAMNALASGDPRDLSSYERRLDELWGPYYRLGRTFTKIIGRPHLMRVLTLAGMRVPPVMSFAFKVLANLYRERGGTAGDRAVRGMLRLASTIRVG